MKLGELKQQIDRLLAEDEYRADANVTFGEDAHPVEGGIIAKNRDTGLVVLNLAPIKLNELGGF